MTEPLVIRGHHISTYINLMSTDDPDHPEEIAARSARTIARQFESSDPRRRRYAIDTMGSPEREEEHKEQTVGLYERFLSAPPDQEIVIVSAEPDDICRLCSVGNHCVTRFKKAEYSELFKEEPYRRQLRNLYSFDAFADYEEAYFKGFCSAYNHLYKWEHIKRPPQIEEVTLRFLDCSYPVKAKRFHTDKESFRWAAGLGDYKTKYYFPWYIY